MLAYLIILENVRQLFELPTVHSPDKRRSAVARLCFIGAGFVAKEFTLRALIDSDRKGNEQDKTDQTNDDPDIDPTDGKGRRSGHMKLFYHRPLRRRG